MANQSPRLFFFKYFFVRYFKCLLEKGTSEVTAILFLLLSMVRTPPSRLPAFPSTLILSWRNCSKLVLSMIPSFTNGYNPEWTSGPASFFCPRFAISFLTVAVAAAESESSTSFKIDHLLSFSSLYVSFKTNYILKYDFYCVEGPWGAYHWWRNKFRGKHGFDVQKSVAPPTSLGGHL